MNRTIFTVGTHPAVGESMADPGQTRNWPSWLVELLIVWLKGASCTTCAIQGGSPIAESPR